MPGLPFHPRTLRVRVWRLGTGLVLIALLAAGVSQQAGAFSDPRLNKAHHQLRQTRERIHAKAAKLLALQKEMNKLATEIHKTYEEIARARIQMEALQDQLKPLRRRLNSLKDLLASRSREAFIMGPAAPILYLLTATSAGEAASRVSLIDEMNRRDALLAARVEAAKLVLARTRDALAGAQDANRMLLDRLATDQEALKEKMKLARRLYRALKARRTEILVAISKIHPFAVCPVKGPVAVADDFGIWVHHTKKEGGNHIHQGNDIMAPEGAPIVAPFDGTAVESSNDIGGLAVTVEGQFGYVYNAHLSAFGTLGQVETGTVIGYVGATGNASGNHDHFEWHPNDGPAVDPHKFLMAVC
jgi:murein DD-endopeptidase MepM/ murein hydrolase activator NlpD